MKLFGSIILSLALFSAPIPTQARTVHHRHSHSRHHYVTAGSARPSKAVNVAMRYLGSGNPTGSKGPWCGDFMNFVEHKIGRKGIHSRMARNWANYGHRSGPVAGAIAVFRGHVGLVINRVGDRIKIISGNYSHRVAQGVYAIRSAIAFRMP